MAIKRRNSSASSRRKPAQRERVGLGGGSVDRHLERSGRKRKSNVWAQIGDGNTVIVRAIDTKKYFKDGYVHPVEFERADGSTYSLDVRCLDPDDEGNPCPGCRDDLDRRYKFWMLVIVRDAPKENKAGKVIGEEDQVRILSGANRLVKALNAKHRRKDLAKRDLEISQNGQGFEVEYEVEWADEEDTPLSDEDQELIENADDVIEAFKFHTQLRDEDEFYDPPSSNGQDEDDDDIGQRSKRRKSAFAERNKKSRAKFRAVQPDEDDEDDEDERPMRRAKIGNKSGGKKKMTSSSRTVKKSTTTRRRSR